MTTCLAHRPGWATTSCTCPPPAPAVWPLGSPLFARALFAAACSAAGGTDLAYTTPADALEDWMAQPGARGLVNG